MKNTEFVTNALKYKGYGYVYGAKGQMYSKAEAERMAKSGVVTGYTQYQLILNIAGGATVSDAYLHVIRLAG